MQLQKGTSKDIVKSNINYLVDQGINRNLAVDLALEYRDKQTSKKTIKRRKRTKFVLTQKLKSLLE